MTNIMYHNFKGTRNVHILLTHIIYNISLPRPIAIPYAIFAALSFVNMWYSGGEFVVLNPAKE